MKKKLFVVGLTSLPGGGKDFVADILVSDYGFYKASPGEIIRKRLKKEHRGVLTREMQQKMQEKWRRVHGSDYIMELCYSFALRHGKKKVVIPGIRFPRDIAFYKRRLDGNFINIFITADPKIRFQRIMARKREDSPASYRDFIRHDSRETKIFNLMKTRTLSDLDIDNSKNGSGNLRKRIRSIMGKYGFRPRRARRL
ncbi:hypothetical protein M1293_03215 [Candidatus Parvarchaeota archaeon]|nr:hypothetical protein [Candidatus Parvarchaeota archaeon]